MQMTMTVPRPVILVSFALASILLLVPNYLWITLTLIVVTQTSVGTPIRQGQLQFAIFTSGIWFATALKLNFPLLAWWMLFGMILSAAWHQWQSRFEAAPYFLMHYLFMLAFAIAFLLPITPVAEERLRDCFIGGFIGLACNLCAALQPLPAIFLRAMAKNIKALQKCRAEECAAVILQMPQWLLETGLNRSLRSGFRFFALTFERIIDHQALMQYYLHLMPTIADDAHIKSCFDEVWQQNNVLLNVLRVYCETQQLPAALHHREEFTHDLQALENALQPYIPQDFDLYDLAPEFPIAIAIMRHARDCRQLLLQLVMALQK